MRRSRFHYLALIVLTACLEGCQVPASDERPPNIVIIMADDMGFSDLGSYGGEIETQYLDLLARRGVRFTQFYNTGRCCPTRASLLTGLYPHQAGMGGMVSSVESAPEAGPYQGYLNETSVTIAEVLRQHGYKTYQSGKWHVGEKKEHWPTERGFDQYFGLISGASSYFEVIEDQPRIRQMALNDEPWTPPDEGFYMTDAISDHAESFIRDHVQAHKRSTPFFLYVPYTAPHWPLHALPEDVEIYDGVYDAGWGVLREQRFKRMKQLGIVDGSLALPEMPASVPDWENVEDKALWARRMEVYAAMVHRMDLGIGRIIKALDETKTIRNTVIFFLSDNGGSPEDVTGRNLHKAASVVGERDSYDAYREPWAHLSNTPFRYYKSWTHEGGIATPLIVYWQGGLQEPGRLIHEPGHVIDLMATSLDLAGVPYPESRNGHTITPVEGKSLLPVLQGEAAATGSLYWEHFGARAIRQGNMKLVAGKDGLPWELYDLEADRNELQDLAASYPDTVQAMATAWQTWADRVGVRTAQ